MSQINKVAVIGAGTMGARIAVVMARAGYRVSLYSRSQETLDKAQAIVESRVAQADVQYSTSLESCLAGADMVSENVAEEVALKQHLFSLIEPQVSADCLLTTNTSSVSITQLASVLSNPQRLIGMHWFNPADTMPMIEIVRGENTADDVCQRVRDLCAQLGKETITVNQDIPGFIINRLQYAMLREALYLVSAGIGSVEDVDRAVQRTLAPRWAAMGPMKLMDFAGLDTVEKVAGILLPALDNSTTLPPWLLEKVAAKQLGVKSGEGFYCWDGQSAAAAMRHREAIVTSLTARGTDDE
ncbi:3-hydroxybutyryl-CoA dehydrogenase [Kosakonia radicincitans]|uniref:3-hydroxyacyl-CoA dehydrogenase family protein n=1 Tax=Kosakonia radicincitans TaxID=283686 RepID=UPI0009034A54|nr:3-hydroxyacyl-CoA dehydrogenase family protein [Kosakonia radicincitans]APG19955.1 3-hydroxybutyryl-CoA dehydrogenase [Kosakonia radicincitans]